MNQRQRTGMIVLSALAVTTPLGLAGETTVTVDVLAGQSLGESLRLVEAYPGDTIPYVITARVEDADPEAVTGLGGAVVTIEFDFGAKQTPELRADDVASALHRYTQTGLAQPGKITDIGGIQDFAQQRCDRRSATVRERTAGFRVRGSGFGLSATRPPISICRPVGARGGDAGR